MHHRFIARIRGIGILAMLLALPAGAANTTWKIDPAHSAAHFSVRHLGISNVRGDFTKIAGAVQLDDQDVTKSTVEVTIDASSVDTRVADRDKDLRSERFFDVANYPTLTFKSKKIEQVGEGKLKVTGDLTIRGVTKEVVLEVEGPTAPIKDPWGNQRTGVTGSTKINRQDFGVKWNAKLDSGGVVVGDEVAITFDIELVKAASAKTGN